jgi:D-serine deaminase-like pyridoxal phosphate-dependent protein
MTAWPDWPIPQGIDTPALLVDAQKVEANARRMSTRLRDRGVRLRPHAKTHKSVQVAELLQHAGATGLTVATIGEAEVFARAGMDDLFIAYPVWASTAKATRLRAVADLCRLRIGVDSVEGANQLALALRGVPIEVLLEVDCGDGRTGVRSPAEALAVAQECGRRELSLVGVFTHGGHSYASPLAARGAADDEVAALQWGADSLETAGFDCQVRSAGSTPTAEHSARDGVTEERPGTFVFGDRQQVHLGACRAEDVALVVAATVVSSDKQHQVVLDAGGKTLAEDRHADLDGFGQVLGFPQGRIIATYDHHAIMRVEGAPLPSVGDVVLIVPNHVCPVVNLAAELLVVADGRHVETWCVDAQTRNR